jgi:hypothetical protein
VDGYIKFYRQVLINPIVCKDTEHFAVWCYLLLNATHNEYDTLFGGKRITLQKGQLITSRKSIVKCFPLSESKVQRILKTFENEQQIEQQKSNKSRLITILNWSQYQITEHQNEQQLNNKRTTTEQQLNTNKKYKNVKNDKNVKKYTSALESAIDDFKEFRKKIKAPMTDRAVELLHLNLNKLATNDETKIAILNQSIVNSWKGVFELKESTKSKGPISILQKLHNECEGE